MGLDVGLGFGEPVVGGVAESEGAIDPEAEVAAVVVAEALGDAAATGELSAWDGPGSVLWPPRPGHTTPTNNTTTTSAASATSPRLPITTRRTQARDCSVWGDGRVPRPVQFGSMAECYAGPRRRIRAESDVCLSNSRIRRYDVGVLQADFAAEALGRCRLFDGMSKESLQAITRTLRGRRFRRGEVLFHEGDPGDALFIVASGAGKVVVPSEDGAEAILATVRRGEFLGELALLDGAPRSASAIALEPTETLALPRDRFRALVATEPAIRDALLAAVAGELRRLTTHVAELHFLDLTGRLAARLARLAEEQGEKLPGGAVRLDAPLTQGDLAAMIGSTRQSVNKVLGEFEADGLIKLERDTILVPSLEKLSRAAHR